MSNQCSIIKSLRWTFNKNQIVFFLFSICTATELKLTPKIITFLLIQPAPEVHKIKYHMQKKNNYQYLKAPNKDFSNAKSALLYSGHKFVS